MIKTNLKKLLAERQMTQSELAEKAHIRPSTISTIYHGVCISVKLHNLDKICKTLNCKVSDLMELMHD